MTRTKRSDPSDMGRISRNRDFNNCCACIMFCVVRTATDISNTMTKAWCCGWSCLHDWSQTSRSWVQILPFHLVTFGQILPYIFLCIWLSSIYKFQSVSLPDKTPSHTQNTLYQTNLDLGLIFLFKISIAHYQGSVYMFWVLVF